MRMPNTTLHIVGYLHLSRDNPTHSQNNAIADGTMKGRNIVLIKLKKYKVNKTHDAFRVWHGAVKPK